MTIKTKFDVGNIVFLLTDAEQSEYIVTAIVIRSNDFKEYLLANGSSKEWHD